ncbi:MAG: carboxypeptidase-like regulatory domain-containing protein [Thermodesulfobacteriota bacterium]|nr:carboxypeptidase-like regulatory domain-containing protein [Thermodesulfobacteriota bacterium]
MKIWQLLILLAVAGVIIEGRASAHGVAGEITEDSGIRVDTRYDDGEPMAYAAVKVFYQEEDLAFQTGRTDRNGRFLFLPDQQGNWRVTVSDSMGHQLNLSTTVAKGCIAGTPNNAALQTGSLSRGAKVIAGLAMLFGIFGFFFWWRGLAREKSRKA